MGRKDILTKDYFSQNDIFADAFNYYLFSGKRVIKESDLSEQDSTEISIFEKTGKLYNNQKYRDILKTCTIKDCNIGKLVLLGIEGQAYVNYAMPVRNYLYDAMNYMSQVDAIRKKHEKSKDLKDHEWLSGFSRNDHLSPVITLCIYLGIETWDGPKSLHDMFRNINPDILKYVDDYKLNLITPHEIDDFDNFHSELGFLLQTIRYSDNKQKFYDIITTDSEKLIGIRTVEMINEYTQFNVPTNIRKGDKVQMCKAVEELIADWKAEGTAETIYSFITEGIIDLPTGAKKLDISVEELQKRMQEKGFKIPQMV